MKSAWLFTHVRFNCTVNSAHCRLLANNRRIMFSLPKMRQFNTGDYYYYYYFTSHCKFSLFYLSKRRKKTIQISNFYQAPFQIPSFAFISPSLLSIVWRMHLGVLDAQRILGQRESLRTKRGEEGRVAAPPGKWLLIF